MLRPSMGWFQALLLIKTYHSNLCGKKGHHTPGLDANFPFVIITDKRSGCAYFLWNGEGAFRSILNLSQLERSMDMDGKKETKHVVDIRWDQMSNILHSR